MKYTFYLLLVLNISTFYAQNSWTVIDLKNEVNNLDVEEVIPVLNSKTGYLATFFKTEEGYSCFLLNDTQEIIKTIKINEPSNKLAILVGSSYADNVFTLFFTNNSGSKYSCVRVDFDTNLYIISEDLNLDLKKEKLISYVENDGAFYALSILKNSSILKLYHFSNEGDVSSKLFDLSKEVFETDNNLTLTLYALLFGKHSDNSFEAIDSNIPNALETTSALTKVFVNDNVLQLTNNTFKKQTYLIDINLQTDAFSYSSIENKKFDKKNLRSNFNSFVLNNLFCDIYSTTDDITFNLYDRQDNTLIKNFNIVAGDSISFKNSPIIHEIVNTNSIRDLEKTSRFIRKVNGSNIGVSAYPYGENYVVILGASEKIQSGEFAMIGGLLGGFVGAAIFSAFDSYNRTQSTRIECLFDKEFNHIEGSIPENGFDLINTFIKENNLKRSRLQTVFKYKNIYIWGSYNKMGQFYRFHQFNPN